MRKSLRMLAPCLAALLLWTLRSEAAGDDLKTVAALDTEYQAAVKRNDAATMDRILAEDFVLVTGRGKTYGKADLLAEARRKSTVYERQDELEQRVRRRDQGRVGHRPDGSRARDFAEGEAAALAGPSSRKPIGG